MGTPSQFDPAEVQANWIKTLRASADARNKASLAAYEAKCANWIEVNVRNRDLGVSLTAVPPIPSCEVVDDFGETTFQPFNPPLLPPSLPPQKTAVSDVAGMVGTGQIGQPTDTDLLNLILVKVTALYNKIILGK